MILWWFVIAGLIEVVGFEYVYGFEAMLHVESF
jgi:hypothetical protein